MRQCTGNLSIDVLNKRHVVVVVVVVVVVLDAVACCSYYSPLSFSKAQYFEKPN